MKRTCSEINNTNTRRILYLSIVRSVFGYSNQVWSPQTINLITRMERVQRRATKFILKLPYLCHETYRERLISLNLLPLCYWHEYLDLVFFFKAINSLVYVSQDVLPQPQTQTRNTRSTSSDHITFRPPKCKTSTYQKSFFIRVTRSWNSLPASLRHQHTTLTQFKTLLLNYYMSALEKCYDEDDPRTWKTICLKCNCCRPLLSELTCCFQCHIILIEVNLVIICNCVIFVIIRL